MSTRKLNACIAKATSPTSRGKKKIWKPEMKSILETAKTPDPEDPEDKPIDQEELALLKGLQSGEYSRSRSANKLLKKFLKNEAPLLTQEGGVVPDPDPVEPDPVGPNRIELRSPRKVWTTTYWPMAGSRHNPEGSPGSNLWAKGGALDKFDKFLEANGERTGALKHEKQPSLNWLVNKPTGYYIPEGTLRENDAERTTGVDLNGNGKIDDDVEWDFLAYGSFGKNDKKDETMGVGWWGSCGQVAMAGVLFQEPEFSVTRNGVTFSTQDIKGLLTVIAKSQAKGLDWAMDRYDGKPDEVRLTNGRTMKGQIQDMEIADFRDGNFRRSDGDRVVRFDYDQDVQIKLQNGEMKTYKTSEVSSISRESKKDSPTVFHTTLKKWLADKRPFSMDHDKGDHVWNDSYDGANIVESNERPEGVRLAQLNGFNGPYKGGKLTFVETELLQGDDVAKSYRYWLEEKNGQTVNSGWMRYSDSPDFMHRPRAAEPSFEGHNSRNPFVKPAMVKELYLASIGRAPRSDAE